jgi:hypothetical protein
MHYTPAWIADTSGGTFLLLTSSPISGWSFTDGSPPTDPKPWTYQVRATRLVTTGSGSFHNLSQGAFVIINQENHE